MLEHLESRDVPAPLSWAAGLNLPTAGAGYVAQPSGANLLVLAGPSTTSYNLSVVSPSWQASVTPTVHALDFARTSPGVGLLPNGYFVVFGGALNGFATSAVTQYDPNTATVTDGSTNQTRALHAMNMPRALLGLATDTSGRDYAIGGENNNDTPLASVEVYNPTANTWAYVASLPQTLYSESAVSDGAGHLFTFGGVGANGLIVNNVYRYTIATNTWDQVAPLQVGVRDSAAVLASNGLIYVIGGATASGATATVESYNIATNTWTLETSLPQPLSSVAAVADSLGRIDVIGGNDAGGNPVSSVLVSQRLNQADQAPSITSAAVTGTVVNGSYSYQVLSTGNPQPTYALTTAPAGMSIDPSAGLITWAPTYATEGIATVTVTATSSVGQATQSFSVAVAPQTPTGLTGTGTSTTSIQLSWDASADPNVTGYNVYRRTFLHNPRGSGGTYHYSLLANVPGNSVIISGSSVSGSYLVSAVNSAGIESARTGVVTVSTWSAPDLFTATTVSGADISSMTVSVGQQAQIYLVQEFANPAPSFSLVSGPSSITVDPNTGLVTYTPSAAEVGLQFVTFAASNAAGSSQYTFLFDVVAINPTLTLDAGEFTYDGNGHAASAAAVGTDGSTPVAGTFTITYNGDATPPTAAGTYAVTASFTSTDPAYADAVAIGTLTIDPATPTISIANGPFDFDGNPHDVSASALGVDGATPVDGAFQITYNGDPNPPIGPGLFYVDISFVSNDPNYAATDVVTTLIINSPGTTAPTLSLADGSATFDGNAHADIGSAFAADGTTPVAGDFIITYNGSTTPPTAAGAYAVVATFISADPTYANAEIDGTLTIGTATPTLNIDPTPLTYNGNGQAALVSALGVDGFTSVAGTFSVTYNGSATLPTDAGTYDVVVSFTSADPNYTSTSIESSITILPTTPSVGLGNGGQWEFTYNGSPQSVIGSAVGIDGLTPINGYFTYEYYNMYGDNTQLFGPPLPGAPTDAGYYTFVEYFTSLDPNYSDGSFSWDFIIDPAELTVSVNTGPFTYNGTTPSPIVTAVGIDGVTPVAGSIYYITYNGSATAPTTAGTYDVYVEFQSADPNYYGGEAEDTLVINKATTAFSNLASPTINVGATSVTVSGRVAGGSVGAGGDAVTITLNGVTQSVAIATNGNFTTTFNIAGLGTGTYPITYEFLGDGNRFNAAGTGFASGNLTIQAAPSILSSPTSQTVTSGSTVTLTASASGYPTPTVQWQQSTNGTTYTNIAGATSATYSFTATASQNNYRYRAVFTNSVGSATTAVATLTVQSAPTVTTNPTSPTVNAGQNATLTAAATGNPTPTVQWQVSTNGGATFTNITGATSATLSLAAVTASQNGYIYRAIFTNSIGSTTTSSATLTVHYAPSVTTAPTTQTVNAGQSVTFTAAAAGNPTPTVQWQVSTNGGSTYSNISGATSTSYTISATTASQNGYRYRAVFTNSQGSATTAAATLTVQSAPTVTTNPSNKSVAAGSSVTFTAAATGFPTPTVQWQVSTDGGLTFTNIAGATSTTLTFTTSASQNGYRYRAVFTNTVGIASSLAAVLTIL